VELALVRNRNEASAQTVLAEAPNRYRISQCITFRGSINIGVDAGT
jgi:hypothetical protein